MFKFFRAIRQNVLSEGNTGKYLKYATGEIILVVVGILIALQINNWNNDREIRALEVKTLVEIADALRSDLVGLKKDLDRLERKIIDTKQLISHIESKKPYEPKLDELMARTYYNRGYDTFNTAAFELLKDRGFSIIKNTDLRKQITKHYTSDLNFTRSVLSRIDNLGLIRAENIFDDFLVYRDHEGESFKIKAHDYNEALANPKLFAPFYHFEVITHGYQGNLEKFKAKTESVLAAIETELVLRNE